MISQTLGFDGMEPGTPGRRDNERAEGEAEAEGDSLASRVVPAWQKPLLEVAKVGDFDGHHPQIDQLCVPRLLMIVLWLTF